MRSVVLALAAAALGAGGASAQLTPDGEPFYGTVQLQAGFSNDPYEVVLDFVGGDRDAASLGVGCVGYVADTPDFNVAFSAGSAPLYISATGFDWVNGSDADVALVVRRPDGGWVCDDDSAGNLFPGVTISPAQSGVYNIWVADYDGDSDDIEGALYISEVGYQTFLPVVPDGSSGGALSASSSGSSIDFTGTPYFGEVSLTAGFTPDPHSISLTAGGANDASTLGAGCVGMIGGPPDYNLNYSAGGYALYISAASDEDITLVVNAPDGAWYCDDDSGAAALDPGLTWNSPQSGLYNIWVGRYGADDYPSATLHISETGYHDTRVDSGASSGTIDMNLTAAYGNVSLTAGFTPDPHTVTVTPGGSIDARTVLDGCQGQVAAAPDYELTYTNGSWPLYIYAESSDDTTLLVNTPDGRWMCDDDSGVGVNPGVAFKAPASGVYDIWVGRYGGGVSGSATLNISETSFPRD